MNTHCFLSITVEEDQCIPQTGKEEARFTIEGQEIELIVP